MLKLLKFMLGKRARKPAPMTPEQAAALAEEHKRYAHNEKVWNSRGYGCICTPHKLANGYYDDHGLMVSSLCPVHGHMIEHYENPFPGTAEYRGRTEYRRIDGLSS